MSEVRHCVSFDPGTDRRATEPFLRDVLAKHKIFVMGNDHDLAELAGHSVIFPTIALLRILSNLAA